MADNFEAEQFDRARLQIRSFYNEIGLLSKKSPDGPINKFKLKYINDVLKDANKMLGKRNKPFKDFENFEEDNLPTNSDVVMILAQYIKAIEEI